jgi:hypothetical protein
MAREYVVAMTEGRLTMTEARLAMRGRALDGPELGG